MSPRGAVGALLMPNMTSLGPAKFTLCIVLTFQVACRFMRRAVRQDKAKDSTGAAKQGKDCEAKGKLKDYVESTLS